MSEKNTVWPELLRQPILVFSVVIAIIALKNLLGLEFGSVTEVGAQGVKFAEQDEQNKATLEAIAALEARVNEAIVRLEDIEKRKGRSAVAIKQVEADAFSASQTVSDATAEIARLQGVYSTRSTSLIGYIWIGNDYSEQWGRVMLAGIDTGQPIELSPDQILPGTEYKVLGNMVLRDGLPANDTDYFRGRRSLGVVPLGSKIIIRKTPVGIDREFAVQYWAEVEIAKNPGGN